MASSRDTAVTAWTVELACQRGYDDLLNVLSKQYCLNELPFFPRDWLLLAAVRVVIRRQDIDMYPSAIEMIDTVHRLILTRSSNAVPKAAEECYIDLVIELRCKAVLSSLQGDMGDDAIDNALETINTLFETPPPDAASVGNAIPAELLRRLRAWHREFHALLPAFLSNPAVKADCPRHGTDTSEMLEKYIDSIRSQLPTPFLDTVRGEAERYYAAHPV
eukprot:m.155678 g.155678  ORF g.155678 m.155678 type:complete len:219 (-) comp17538_c0_seq4:1957-2613(-)